jgi:hypothetical protein
MVLGRGKRPRMLWKKGSGLNYGELYLYFSTVCLTLNDHRAMSELTYSRGDLSAGPPPQDKFCKELIPNTLVSTKFVQARVIYHWLLDLVKDYVSRYVDFQQMVYGLKMVLGCLATYYKARSFHCQYIVHSSNYFHGPLVSLPY